MCGLYGIIGRNFRRGEAAEGLLNHRGPDSQAWVVDSKVPCWLGHTRLSILDLSDAGAQPMTDLTGRYTVVFNGEIYNFRELKSDLMERGYRFVSDSDTEVILLAFREWGWRCVEKFRGMFALAILDRGPKFGRGPVDHRDLPQQEPYLFLARDRLGIKPLVYAKVSGGLAFASELRAIKPMLDAEPDISTQALNDYAVYQAVYQPKTIYEGVQCVDTGSVMFVSGGGDILGLHRYWDAAEAAATHKLTYANLPSMRTARSPQPIPLR